MSCDDNHFTLDDAGRIDKVLVDGEDVTMKCDEASEGKHGWVQVFDDPPVIKDDELQRHIRFGQVEVKLKQRQEQPIA